MLTFLDLQKEKANLEQKLKEIAHPGYSHYR